MDLGIRAVQNKAFTVVTRERSMTLHHTVCFFHEVGTKCEHLHARVTETVSRA